MKWEQASTSQSTTDHRDESVKQSPFSMETMRKRSKPRARPESERNQGTAHKWIGVEVAHSTTEGWKVGTVEAKDPEKDLFTVVFAAGDTQ